MSFIQTVQQVCPLASYVVRPDAALLISLLTAASAAFTAFTFLSQDHGLPAPYLSTADTPLAYDVDRNNTYQMVLDTTGILSKYYGSVALTASAIVRFDFIYLSQN